MRKISSFLLVFCLLAVPAFAQAPGTVTIAWIASVTPSVTYNVYHSAAATGPWVKLNTTPITLLGFTDTVNSTGFWTATAVDAKGDESAKGIPVGLPSPPTGLKAVGN
jgi:hypothetical protein